VVHLTNVPDPAFCIVPLFQPQALTLCIISLERSGGFFIPPATFGTRGCESGSLTRNTSTLLPVHEGNISVSGRKQCRNYIRESPVLDLYGHPGGYFPAQNLIRTSEDRNGKCVRLPLQAWKNPGRDSKASIGAITPFTR
jgi:hypothetical protein